MRFASWRQRRRFIEAARLLFHIRGANASFLLEKHLKLCYNKTKKGGGKMKKIYSKIPAMIGMLVTMIGVVLLIGAFIISNNEVEPESGVSRSFALAILALITALCSLIFYLIDAVLSVIKVFKNINPVFNGVLALVIVVTIPVIFARNNLPDIRIAICAVTIFVFEIISVIKHIQLMMNDKQKQNIE